MALIKKNESFALQFEDKDSALSWLYSKRAFEPRLSLLPLCKAAHELGDPHLQLRSIQIAGTNGKGSVCHKVARALHACKIRVGLFTSPHLDDFGERICIDLEPIKPREMLHELNELLRNLSADSLRALGFFDLTFLMALTYFQKGGIDLAIFEVGIGGRLDATSICRPQLTAITSIGFDHELLLGSTKREIAAEKGGIIRPQIPLVLGPKAQGLGLEEMAQKRKAPLHLIKGNDLHFDKSNSEVAKKLLALLAKNFSLSKSMIEKWLTYRPACRFEVVKLSSGEGKWPEVLIIDVAHNEQAFEHLAELMLSQGFARPLYIAFGLSRSKSLMLCLQQLQRLMPERLFPQELEGVSSFHHQEIATAAQLCKIPTSAEDERALDLFSLMSGAKTLLVCGSFHLAATMRQKMQMAGLW